MIGSPIGSGSISVCSVTLRRILRLSIKPLGDISEYQGVIKSTIEP